MIDKKKKSIAKIDIQTEDDTNYLELAILFDKPEFLRLIPQFRKDYGVDHTLSEKEYDNVINGLDKKNAKINFSKYQNPKGLKKDYKSITGLNPDTTMDMYQMLDTETNIICYLFKRPPCFSFPIERAIFRGVVCGDWLGLTSVEVIENGRLLNVADFQLPQLAILISPTTTYKVLKSSFQIAQTMYKTDPELSYFKPRVDFIKNIRQYREWYWERQNGKTYQKIADDWVEKQLPKEDLTTYLEVMRGVKIYKKLLEK